MRGAKRVVVALTATGKPRQPAKLPQTVHAVAPARQDFVWVGLMAHIPHQAVFGGVENIVQGHRQLHRAKVGTQVSTGFGHRVKQVGTQLVGQCPELAFGQLAQVCGAVDVFKQ